MSMGTFDAAEHERREKRLSRIRTDTDDQRPNFKGRLRYIEDDSVDELLARWKKLKEAQHLSGSYNPISLVTLVFDCADQKLQCS